MSSDEIIQMINRICPEIGTDSIKLAVEIFFEEVQKNLLKQGKVELRRFGIFSVQQRMARKARNPNTGEAVLLPAQKYLRFKMSKNLQAEIN